MTRVLLVTTWDIPCGVSEHSFYLKESVEAADQSIEIVPNAQALDPMIAFGEWMPNRQGPFTPQYDICHLNYHMALHSRWTVERIEQAKAAGLKVLVTLHDSGVPNSDQAKAICAAADYFVVHEPYDDLPSHGEYLRMGVPAYRGEYVFDLTVSRVQPRPAIDAWGSCWTGARPVLGTVGFPFPWKNYDELARITGELGWALLLIAPGATLDQIDVWEKRNPYLCVLTQFTPRGAVLSLLGACDATAFTYVCHNTGQSGAILQGIAARKPVIALSTCRQFRALQAAYPFDISWAEDFGHVSSLLRNCQIQRVDPRTVYVAEQESWSKVGARYAAIYREMVR